jgi:hypothetical protein
VGCSGVATHVLVKEARPNLSSWLSEDLNEYRECRGRYPGDLVPVCGDCRAAFLAAQERAEAQIQELRDSTESLTASGRHYFRSPLHG